MPAYERRYFHDKLSETKKKEQAEANKSTNGVDGPASDTGRSGQRFRNAEEAMAYRRARLQGKSFPTDPMGRQ